MAGDPHGTARDCPHPGGDAQPPSCLSPPKPGKVPGAGVTVGDRLISPALCHQCCLTEAPEEAGTRISHSTPAVWGPWECPGVASPQPQLPNSALHRHHHHPGALGVLAGGSHCGDTVTALSPGIPQAPSQRGPCAWMLFRGIAEDVLVHLPSPCPDQALWGGQQDLAGHGTAGRQWDGWLGGGAKWL